MDNILSNYCLHKYTKFLCAPIFHTSGLKYDAIETEFSWDVGKVLEEICSDYNRRDDIKGEIYTTQKHAHCTKINWRRQSKLYC